MAAEPPNIETTLARDGLAFITTHPSLKPAHRRSTIAHRRAVPEAVVVDAGYSPHARAKLDAVLKPNAGSSTGRGRPRRFPAKYYHDGLYPARCNAGGPDGRSAKSPLTQTNVGKSVRAGPRTGY